VPRARPSDGSAIIDPVPVFRSRPALIIASLGATIAVVAWSARVYDREVTRNFRDLTDALELLDATKQRFEAQVQRLDPSSDLRRRPADTSGAADRDADGLPPLPPLARTIEEILVRLAERPDLDRRTGTSTMEVVRDRARRTAERLLAAEAARSGADRAAFVETFVQAKAEFERLHLLIERIEARLIVEVGQTLEHRGFLRDDIERVVLTSFAASVLVGILAIILFRRWVILEIGRLRTATDRLSAGDFAYRIPITRGDEFGQLSAEVNRMAATIVEVQARLVERERLAAIGELVRRLVHNLRNPLAGIRSLAELTRSALPADSDERENQDRIVATVDRFEHWLREILQSTNTIEAEKEPGRLEALLRSVAETHQGAAASRGVALETYCEPAGLEARFDARHLEQAVSALVSNAIEATPAKGRVRVIGRRRGDDEVEVRVEDSGPGVTPDLVERIFVPWFTTKRHGTGIGLALVRNVAHAHGGRARVERAEALPGAAFVVSWPG